MIKKTLEKENSKIKGKKSIAALLLGLLLISSSFVLLSSLPITPLASADSGDLMQYEWPQWYGSEGWDNFNPGPAPNAGDLLWRVNVTGALVKRYYPAAFNGKVFLYSTNRMIAIDGITGGVAWDKKGYNTGMPYKLDNTHMVAGQTCFNPNNGDVYWTRASALSPLNGANVSFATSGGWGGGAGYSSTEKLFFTGGRAWNLSDPDHWPTIAWDISGTIVGGESFDAYGMGIVVIKSGDMARGINATNGKVVWSHSTTGGFESYCGMYYDGIYYKGQIDRNFIALNMTTGKEIWHYYDDTPFSNWACGTAAAYGMVYAISGDGKIYAFNAKTGAVVWIYQSQGWMRYQGHPLVADGKVYATCPDIGGKDPYTGATPDAYYVCLDAYTGKLIWTVKGVHVSESGGGSHLIAFGNLYLICEDGYLRCYGTAKSEWPMFRHDPQLSGVGLSGPNKFSLRWKYHTDGPVYSSPSIVNDKVYIGSYDNNLYCFDALTGAKIWTYNMTVPIGWSPAVYNGKVYTGATDGFVHCLNANTGELIWKKACGPAVPQNMTAGYLQSSPIIKDNKLFVGALDSYLYCLDINNNGNILWRFETAPGSTKTANTAIKATPAIDGNTVWTVGTPWGPTAGMFGTAGNISLYQIDFNGNLLKEIKYPYGLATAPTTASVFASPLIVGDYIVIPDQTVYWYCINKTSGEVVWKYLQTYQTQFANSAVYIDGAVVLTDGFFCQKMNITNGDIIWREFLKREIFNSATIAGYGSFGDNVNAIDRMNMKIYSSNNDNMFHILNFSYVPPPLDNTTLTAKLDWTYEPQSFIISSFSLYKGMAYIGGRDFYVYCYEEASTQTTVYPTISVAASKSSLTMGDYVNVTGAMFPKFADVPVKVTFIRPDKSMVDLVPWTDANGTYKLSYYPDAAGLWGIIAWYNGDAGKKYESCYSETLALNVAAKPSPSVTPSPSPTQAPTPSPTAVITPAPTPTQTQPAAPTASPTPTQTTEPTPSPTTVPPPQAGTLDVYMISAIVAIIIVVIAAAAVLLRRRK